MSVKPDLNQKEHPEVKRKLSSLTSEEAAALKAAWRKETAGKTPAKRDGSDFLSYCATHNINMKE